MNEKHMRAVRYAAFTPALSILQTLVDAVNRRILLMDGMHGVPEWLQRLVDNPSDYIILRVVCTVDYSIKRGTRSGIPAYEVRDTCGLDVKWLKDGLIEPLSGFTSLSVPEEDAR